MMQNHYEILSKYHFWTRNLRNWTKSPDWVMSGPVQEDTYGPHMGPYGPIWVYMGPYGPIRAHMGPYGAHMGPYGAHMGPYTRKFPKIPRKFHGFPWISTVEPLWSHCGFPRKGYAGIIFLTGRCFSQKSMSCK